MEEEHTAVHDEIILLEVIQDDSQLAENEEEIINFSEESLVKILNANIGHISKAFEIILAYSSLCQQKLYIFFLL